MEETLLPLIRVSPQEGTTYKTKISLLSWPQQRPYEELADPRQMRQRDPVSCLREDLFCVFLPAIRSVILSKLFVFLVDVFSTPRSGLIIPPHDSDNQYCACKGLTCFQNIADHYSIPDLPTVFYFYLKTVIEIIFQGSFVFPSSTQNLGSANFK